MGESLWPAGACHTVGVATRGLIPTRCCVTAVVSTSLLELLSVGFVLLATVAVGTVIHELSHAAALRAFAIPFEVTGGSSGDGGTRHGFGTLASVRPLGTSQRLSPVGLRVAAGMPLLMLAPLGLILGGLVPDPVASGDTLGTAVVVGWLATALPSPQDWSVLFHADRAIARQQASECPATESQ